MKNFVQEHPYQVPPPGWNAPIIPNPGQKDPRNSNGPCWNQ